ncbi:hypothetical protein ACFLYO_01090 [Chloroflexota bacterium]
MKKIVTVGLLALLMVVLFVPVMAQDEVRLQDLRVGLWPEFDEAALLVIYWGEVAPDVTFPATVSLRIPAAVDAPHVVAAQVDEEGSVDEVTYENTVDGEWRTITFETNGPHFQFEYYDTLNKDGSARTTNYVWPGDYAVDQLSVELQQPPHSDAMTTTPALANTQVNANDNLIYHGGQFGPLAVGETLPLAIEYTRDTDELTVALLSAMQPQSEPVNSGPSAPPAVASGAGGTDIILLVVVAVIFFLLGAAAMRVAINIQTLSK